MMNVILLRKRGRSYQVDLRHPLVFTACLFLATLLLGSVFFSGFMLARHLGAGDPSAEVMQWKQKLAEQQKQLDDARTQAQYNIDALAARVGELNAHVIRLDALGQRLTKMAGLDQGEFNFDKPPAQGGPEEPLDSQSVSTPDFMHALDQLAGQISDREQQLSVLENLIMSRNLQQRVMPAGRPVLEGWMSSGFGVRTDPFTGRLAHHYGMDFAGKEGDDVIAVASGVVTWAGPRYGYGNLVEINHGNGYATRYGHNEKVLVKVGETVKKGQVIAHMGSTGRSTGPHVHFEVLLNGKVVNPARYIRASG